MRKHIVQDYINICKRLEANDILVNLLLIIYEAPYVNVRSSMDAVDSTLAFREVEFNNYSFSYRKNACELTLFINGFDSRYYL